MLPRSVGLLLVILTALAGCASPATGLPEGLSAAYRVRVEEMLLLEGLIGYTVYTASVHRDQALEFTARLSLGDAVDDRALLIVRLTDVALVSPEEKRFPDQEVRAWVEPSTGRWLEFEPVSGGGGMIPARLESWVRGLLLPVPERGQVLPETFWFQAERYHLPAEALPLPAGTDLGFDLPWRLELERLDQIDGRPVASLLVSRAQRFPPGEDGLTGGISASGFARVDAATGLTRTADWQESGRFGVPLAPLTHLGPPTPWLLVTLENRITLTRLESGP